MTLSPWARYAALASHLALIAALTVTTPPAIALVLAVPLLLPLPGLLRARDYTYAWSTLLLAFYAAGYLAAGYAQPAEKWRCFGIAALAALDFAALNLYVKFRARERTAQTAASAAASR